METNEAAGQSAPETELSLTFEGQTYLREAGKWAGFLGIIGFILCGLFLILALFIGTLFSTLGQLSPAYAEMPAYVGTIYAVFLVLIDVMYFFFALYLYQFSVRIKKGIVFTDQFLLTQGLGKLKSFFKLAGILTIVIIALYILIFLLAILGAITNAHH